MSTSQSEVGALQRLVLKHIRDAFTDQATIERAWRDLNFTAAPDWVRRRLTEGLGGVVLYAWNVESHEQLAALTTDLRSERPDILVAIDEEGGDVTRLEAATGSSYPGNAALGAVDNTALTEQVAASIGADLVEVGVNLDFAPVADATRIR
jgi:beta-N-acetylhexosaminidase